MGGLLSAGMGELTEKPGVAGADGVVSKDKSFGDRVGDYYKERNPTGNFLSSLFSSQQAQPHKDMSTPAPMPELDTTTNAEGHPGAGFKLLKAMFTGGM